MKKSLSLALSLIMIISTLLSINITAYADSSGTCGTNGNNLLWSLSGTTLTISKGESGEARMANFVNGGAARPGWYDSRTSIKRIVLEDGVINVGAYAFDGCTAVSAIDFGTIDTLGNNACQGCTSLVRITLPDTLGWMYSGAFQDCTSLKIADIGERARNSGNVPDTFFKNCTALRLVKIGAGYTGFDSNVFEGCDKLKVVVSDNSSLSYDGITVVSESTFNGTCSANTYSSTPLTYSYNSSTFTLTFTGSGDMNSVPWEGLKPVIDSVSFAGTDGKVSIDTSAFETCSNLTSVNFKNVYSIGWGAFGRCYNLGSVQFDGKLAEIWDYAFSECTSLSEIRFGSGTQDLHIRHHAFNLCTGTTYWLNIPENTSYIDDYAFWKTNFNYVKVYNPNVVLGEEVFGDGKGGYARFFGIGGQRTSMYEYVLEHTKQYKNKRAYNWHYYCLSDHVYGESTVQPTCTEKGYDRYGCIYCEDSDLKSNYVDALGHDFEFIGMSGANYEYKCSRCGENDFEFSAIDPMLYFPQAISTYSNNDNFDQPTYDDRLDFNHDGFVNGRDWAYIKSNIDNIDVTNKETTIDTTTTYQTIEGWGASGAWWAQEVGAWENTKDVLRYLYSKNGGIGLNIYRYNVGAGSQDDSSLYNVGTRTRCFLQADGTYNWDNDPGAMNALYWANKFCPNVKVELFSNSAPVSMTKNGRAYCSPADSQGNIACNLDESNYQAFTDFYITTAKHFIDEGYNVTELSPINEPEWGWTYYYNGDGSISCGQEGCHWEYGDARTFYNNYFVPSIRDDEVLGENGRHVDIAVWECAQLNHGYWFQHFMNYLFNTKNYDSIDRWGRKQGGGWAASNSNIWDYVDTLDTHSYWAGESDRHTVMNDWLNTEFFTDSIKKVKCSEYCQMYNDGNSGVVGHTQAAGGSSNGMDIDYGLAMADIIYQDMTILNAVEWDWWTACGKGVYTDSLVYVDANDHSNIQPAKRLWCLGNYSKFIQEGAKRIEVTTGSQLGANLYTKPENIYTWYDGDNSGVDKYNYLEQSAYLNPDGTVAIVYINNSDTIEYTSVADNGYDYYKSYVTDETRDLELYQSGSTSEAVCLPARSVTTVVLKNVTPAKSRGDAYLFSYFTGNKTSEQRIHFAVSKDGYNFTPLNDNEEVITQTMGTLNCRDPYIFKGQDDYYYIIATDMDCNTGWWGNSNSMVLWRSRDLVNWTDETIINMAQVTNTWLGRCWAPQVIWDEAAQKYMVYFSMYTDGDDKGTVIYYSHTDNLLDQSSYSYPQVLFAPESGKDAIDGDIIYDSKNGTYYLYYKDENNATICYVTSSSLTGPYSTEPQKVLESDVALEGCNSYFINGTDTLVMLADAYLNGYFVLNRSNDFTHFTTLDNSESTINATSPRHGSVVSISNDEYNRLVNAFGTL